MSLLSKLNKMCITQTDKKLYRSPDQVEGKKETVRSKIFLYSSNSLNKVAASETADPMLSGINL